MTNPSDISDPSKGGAVKLLRPIQRLTEQEQEQMLFCLSSCINAPVAVQIWRDQGNDGKLMVTLIPLDQLSDQGTIE